jgi:membrane protease YdiL (CAAX protease family)
MGSTWSLFRNKVGRRAEAVPSTAPPASDLPLNTRTQIDGGVEAPVRQVVVFFLLTYAFTWAFFLVAMPMPSGPRTVLILVGALGPSLIAIVLTARSDGRAGVKELLGRLLKWRVKLRWYAFALGYMAAVKLTVAVIFRIGHGRWPHFGEHSVATILVLIVVVGIIGGPLGEEIGWRGYALPRLAQRFGLAPAGLMLGLVWSFWHLPLFLLSVGGDQFGQSFPTYLLQVTALSVAMAWLMGNTGGSLLLAVLFHSAINQTKDIVPSTVTGAHQAWALSSSSVAWLTVAVLWVGAAYFLSRMPWHGTTSRAAAVPTGGRRDRSDPGR